MKSFDVREVLVTARGVCTVAVVLLGGVAPLHSQWTSGSGGTVYYNGGNVGISTATPRANLDVGGQIIATNRLTLTQDTGTKTTSWQIDNASGLFRLFWQPNIDTAGSAIFFATTAGNIGIQTADPQYPLSVNGIIQGKEIIVNTGWSDHVFDSGYHLRPLEEVAVYIKQNHHLPDMPAEAEAKEKGLPVGEMEAKLLAKVEELTLQMIALN